MKQHALYRFYDAGGQLLYVGITVDPSARWKKHGDTKEWWPDVRGVSVEWYDTRPEALAAETRAIQIERPLHNIQRPHLPGRRRSTATVKPVIRQLLWVCEVCRKPIADGAGYIHVQMADVFTHEEQRLAFEKKHSDEFGLVISGDAWTELDEMARPAHWHAHHRSCDPYPDGNDYWFDVERARTHAHLLNWTAHLMEKEWLQETDWNRLIDRMAGVQA